LQRSFPVLRLSTAGFLKTCPRRKRLKIKCIFRRSTFQP
jgi:hypothetical protein